MSDDPSATLSFLQAMRAELNAKLDRLLEGQRTADLRIGAHDRSIRSLRVDAADANELSVDQQKQLTWIKDRLTHLEEFVGTVPPRPQPPEIGD